MRGALALSALLSVWLCVALSGCGTANSGGGHVVGNGGDELVILFRKGAEHARGVLGWLNHARLQRTGGELDEDDEFVLNAQNKSEISDELQSVHIEPVDVFPDFCIGDAARGAACTMPWRGANVYLLRDRCKGMSVVEASEIMMHEVLHHFLGADERRVYRLGARIYRGFTELTTYVFPKHVRQTVRNNPGAAPAIWDGEALLSWNPYRDQAVGRFIPGSGWTETRLTPKPWWLVSEAREQQLKPASNADDIMLYSPKPGLVYSFFYKAGFDRLFGFSMDFDVCVNTRTGTWKTLDREGRAPRWGITQVLYPSARVRYAASKDYFVVGVSMPNERLSLSVFNPETETWKNHTLKFKDQFHLNAAMLIGNSARFVGKFNNRPANEMHVLRVDLKTYEWREEPALKDTGNRFFGTITPVNGGVVIFGGYSDWRLTLGATTYRQDGAFLADDATEWKMIPECKTVKPIDGNLLVIRERDRLHFFGDQWNTWEISDAKWESHPRDAGSFFAKMKMVIDAGDQMIFWNPLSRDGFAIGW